MSSCLRFSFTPPTSQTAQITRTSSLSLPPLRTQQPSTTPELYDLAYTVRGRLTKQAALADRNMRLIVHQANLLDTLMYELSLPQPLDGPASSATSHPPVYNTSSLPPAYPEQQVVVKETNTDDWDDEDSDDDDDLSLSYTSSHNSPELVNDDSESESEDGSLSPSSPHQNFSSAHISAKLRRPLTSTSSYPLVHKTDQGFSVCKASPRVAIMSQSGDDPFLFDILNRVQPMGKP